MLGSAQLSPFENRLERLCVAFRSNSHALAAIFIAAISFLILYCTQYADNDLFARVAAGWLITTTGHVPRTDPFAFTMRNPVWYDHEWLSGLFFYYISRCGGDTALFLAAFLFLLATALLLAGAQRHVLGTTRNSILSIAALAWIIVESFFVWSAVVRSQAVTYLCFAWMLYVFSAPFAQRRKLYWAFPPLMAVWINAHGFSVFGLGVIALFLAADLRRNSAHAPAILAVLFLCVFAFFLNPYGLDYLKFLSGAVSRPRPLIEEWMPVQLQNPADLPVIAAVLFALWGIVRHAKAVRGEVLILMPFLIAMLLVHQRLMPFFFFTLATFGLPWLLISAKKFQTSVPRMHAILRRAMAASILLSSAAGCMAAGLFGVKAVQGNFALRYGRYPVAAMAWLERQPISKAKLLVHFNQGSFALWRGYPKALIAVDGRYEELYPEETVIAALAAIDVNSPQHAQALAEIAPDLALLCRALSPLPPPESFAPGWVSVYADSNCEIFSSAAMAEKLSNAPSPDVPLRPMWAPPHGET